MEDFPEKQLVINYLLGICTPREERQVINWLDKDPGNIYLLQQVAKNLEKESPLSIADKQEIKENIFDKIESGLKNKQSRFLEKNRDSEKKKSTNGLYKATQFWVKAAAVLLVIATAAIGVFYYHSVRIETEETVWKTRSLSYGQTATLRFSDGSKIKLNGGSTLRYPEKFSRNIRRVYLEGEAFFSIGKNESRPFIVHAGDIITRVMGTSFNIKAYDNGEKVQVAVEEGKVVVSENQVDNNLAEENKRVVLGKNQWVTYQTNSQLLEKGEGDIWEMIAWKNHVLVFNNKPFEVVARMLERWYGVEIIIKDERLKSVVLQGEHEDVSLEKVLNSIQFVLGNMEYTIDGDVVKIRSSKKNSIKE